MSNELDGQVRPVDIDTIKELLRKLEEVAERDSAAVEPVDLFAPLLEAGEVASNAALDAGLDATSDVAEVLPAGVAVEVVPADGLASLQRRPSATASLSSAGSRPSPEGGPRAILIQTMPVSEPATKVARAVSALRGKGAGIAIASFALGCAVAGALVIAYEPLKQTLRGPGAVAAKPLVKGAELGVAMLETLPGEASARQEAARQEYAEAPVIAREPVAAAATVATSEISNVTPSGAAGGGTVAVAGSPSGSRSGVDVPRPAEMIAAVVAIPVADAPHDLRAPDRLDLRGGERRTLDLMVEPMPAEAARLLVVLRNVPAWLSLSKGGAIGKEIWLLPAHQANDLAVEIVDGASGAAEIKIQLATLGGQILAERVLLVRAFGTSKPASGMVASAPPASEQMIQRLQARGELLLDTGEVEAARTLFRTAAESGSVSAALRLAETYDPGEIQRFGMMEAAADPILAVRWYEHAQALGSPVATARLATLARR